MEETFCICILVEHQICISLCLSCRRTHAIQIMDLYVMHSYSYFHVSLAPVRLISYGRFTCLNCMEFQQPNVGYVALTLIGCQVGHLACWLKEISINQKCPYWYGPLIYRHAYLSHLVLDCENCYAHRLNSSNNFTE